MPPIDRIGQNRGTRMTIIAAAIVAAIISEIMGL